MEIVVKSEVIQLPHTAFSELNTDDVHFFMKDDVVYVKYGDGTVFNYNTGEWELDFSQCLVIPLKVIKVTGVLIENNGI